MVMLWLCHGYIVVMLWPLLWLLRPLEERLYYGCQASQERIDVSAVPVAPHISLQPLSSHLAYHGFSEQYSETYSETIGITNRISNATGNCFSVLLFIPESWLCHGVASICLIFSSGATSLSLHR